MFTTQITINATTEEEIIYALEEVKRKIEYGFLNGSDQREDNITDYSFATDGEESESVICPECGDYNYYENEEPTKCWNCNYNLEEK